MPLLCGGNIPTLPLLISQSSQNITIKPWFMKLDALHFLQNILEVSSSQVSDIYQTSVAITVVSKTSPASDPLSQSFQKFQHLEIHIIKCMVSAYTSKKNQLLLEKSFLTHLWELFQWKVQHRCLSIRFSFHSNLSHIKSSLLM